LASDDFNPHELYETLTKLASIRRRTPSPDNSRDYSILIGTVQIVGPEELVEYQCFIENQHEHTESELRNEIRTLEDKIGKADNDAAIKRKAMQENVIAHYSKTENQILDAIEPLCSQSAYFNIENALEDVFKRLTAECIDNIE